MELEVQLPFIDGRLPQSFQRRVVVVPRSQWLAYEPPDWHDAIVAIDQGSIELETPCGGRARYTAGDLVWFDGLDLSAVINTGPDPAVLIAVRRRARMFD